MKRNQRVKKVIETLDKALEAQAYSWAGHNVDEPSPIQQYPLGTRRIINGVPMIYVKIEKPTKQTTDNESEPF